MAEKFEGRNHENFRSPAGSRSGSPLPPGLIGFGALAMAACGEKAVDQAYPVQPHTQALEAADIPHLGARELIPCTEFGDNHPNVIQLADRKIMLFANAGRLYYIYFDAAGACHREQFENLPEGNYTSAIIYYSLYSGRMQLRIADDTGQILQTEVEFDFGGNLEVTSELTATELTTDPTAGIVKNNVGYGPVGQMAFARAGVLQLQNLQNGEITDTEISLPNDFAICGLPHTDGISVGSYLKMVGDGVYMCTLIYSDELATLYELRQEIPGAEGGEGKKDPRIDGDSIVYIDDNGDEGFYRRRKQEPDEGGDDDGDDTDGGDDGGDDDDDAGENPDVTPECAPTRAPLDEADSECTVDDNIFQGECTLEVDLCEGKSVSIKLNGKYDADILEKTGQLLLGMVKVDTAGGGDFDTLVNQLLIDGLANGDYGAELSSFGELLVYCTEGQVDIILSGHRILSLRAGDYARFDSSSGVTLSSHIENGLPDPLTEVPRDYLFSCQSGQSGEAAPSLPFLGILLILASRKLRWQR